MHQLSIAAQSGGGRLRTCDPHAALHLSLLFFALLQYPGSLSPVSTRGLATLQGQDCRTVWIARQFRVRTQVGYTPLGSNH